MRFRSRCAGDLLGVAAIDPDGLLLRSDGVYVRYLEVGVVNPLTIEAEELQRISKAFAGLAARLPDRQSLQFYVQGLELPIEELLAEEAFRVEQSAQAAEEDGEAGRAEAIRLFGSAQEESLRTGAMAVNPLALRHIIVCPWKPGEQARGVPWSGGAVNARVHERAVRESLRHCEGIRWDLEAMRLPARMLDGSEVLDLLHSRFDPEAVERGTAASFMSPEAIEPITTSATAVGADEGAGRIAEAVCTAPLDLTDPTQIGVGGSVEQVFYVSVAPEETWLGWLLHLMQAPRPFTLAVHVQATERYRERMAQKRRYRRLYGVNRGVEQHGRPLDPDARLAEEEAAELMEELASSAGGIFRVSIYTAIREPDGDAEARREVCESLAREVTMACDARVQQGRFAQAQLWQSSLPLGRDTARRRRRYVSRNVGDTVPLVGTGCSGPRGIPLGYAQPGRTLVRIDPFDPKHGNHLMLVNGMMGAGKTMLAILVLVRMIAMGACAFIIDRAGHFAFLASLIPGAVSVEIAADAHAINCWDVEDPGHIPAEKIDYLLSLHSLLLGEHRAGQDSYGLSDLESNLLGLAIGEVYERCALSDEEPRELLLQEELQRRYHDERDGGSIGISETLRSLAMRLNNYIGDGPYAYLADRPTTIPPDAPLMVFDTKAAPEAKIAAVLFVVCEHIKSRVTRTRREYLASEGPREEWAGRSVLVVDESWKLIERASTGRWFNDLVRRSRHLAICLIAISQQLSDFDTEYGRVLLKNTRIRLFTRQETRELAYVKETLGLVEEAIEAISSLQTYPGLFSTAYVMNGGYGAAMVQLWVGARDYWIATSSPDRDEHVRALALRQAKGVSTEALELLISEAWQQSADEERGIAV